MDWLSWQDVLEEEIETAVEEKRPLPSETELMKKAGIPTSLEDVAESVPQLKALLERRRALEDKMSGLLGGAPKAGIDPRFDRLFNAPIPEDPQRPTRRVQPLSLEPKPLRERQREDQEDHDRRARLQDSSLARRAAMLDHNLTEEHAREGRLEDRVRDRLKQRFDERNTQRTLTRDTSREAQRVQERAKERTRERTQPDKPSRSNTRDTSREAAKARPERLVTAERLEAAAGMTLDLLDQRKKGKRLSSTMDMVMATREARQERMSVDDRPVQTRQFAGTGDGRQRLLVRALGSLSMDDLDKNKENIAQKQRERIAQIRREAEKRRKRTEDVFDRAEKRTEKKPTQNRYNDIKRDAARLARLAEQRRKK